MIRLPLLSNSSLTAFRRCPREYYFRYVLLRKPRKVAETLRFGSFFHVGLNAWWTWTGDPGIKLGAALDAVRLRAANNPGDSDPFELAKAEVLLEGYTARWWNEGYEAIAVEQMFRYPLTAQNGAEFDIGGAIDAIATKYGTTKYIIEHKTTSSDISPGSDYWRHVVALDPQVSTYLAAAKSLGHDVKSCIYDAVRKPTIVPMKATPDEQKKYTKPTKSEPIPRLYAAMRENDETVDEYRERLRADIIARPGWYFQRMQIVRLEADNAAHARDVWDTAQMIRFAEDRGAWPRSPNACERFGRRCEYASVCEGQTTIEDDARYMTKTRQHEELEI